MAITPEMAKAELLRRNSKISITPEMAKIELEKRKSIPLEQPQQNESPFKSILKFATTPLSKTLGMGSLQDATISTVNQDRPEFQSDSAPFDRNLGMVKPRIGTETFVAGSVGSAADMVQTPASFIPIPGAKLIGKIPVGSTNVGRIASNVAVGKGFKDGVKELQRMESALEQSGKLSSRGLSLGTKYNPAANQTVIQAHNYINVPPASKFKTPGRITIRDKRLIEGYQTINDIVGDIKPTTVEEAVKATQQVKKDLYRAYTSQAQGASAGGATVDLVSIAKKELEPLLNNEQIKTHRKSLIPAIEGYINDFKRRGKISIDDAQNDLETLNVDIRKSIQSGTVDEQNLGAIKERISQAIRNQSDQNIMDTLGKGSYQDLRNKYGSVATVAEELLKAQVKQLKPTGGVAHPVLDVMSGVDLSQALINSVTGNPVGAIRNVVEAISKQGIKGGLDSIKNPNNKIKFIFKELNKSKIQPKEIDQIGRVYKSIKMRSKVSNP